MTLEMLCHDIAQDFLVNYLNVATLGLQCRDTALMLRN